MSEKSQSMINMEFMESIRIAGNFDMNNLPILINLLIQRKEIAKQCKTIPEPQEHMEHMDKQIKNYLGLYLP